MLGPVIEEGKVIPRNYGHISHLPGSKMIDAEDKLLGEQEIRWLTERRKSNRDVVIISEKLDGMNSGVLRMDNLLYPIIRKGYDVRANKYDWIRNFARFVEDNGDRFMNLLKEGERVCGEWLIKTHTIQYKFNHEPFAVFDLISGSRRAKYQELVDRTNQYHFTRPGLLHIGEAMPTDIAMQLLENGYHGAIEGPEGIVYRYENLEKFVFSGKFVANKLVGNQETFRGNEPIYNIVKHKYWQYFGTGGYINDAKRHN